MVGYMFQPEKTQDAAVATMISLFVRREGFPFYEHYQLYTQNLNRDVNRDQSGCDSIRVDG
jgi:hypothetical protein